MVGCCGKESVVSGREEELLWRGAGRMKKIILPLYLTIIRHQQKDQAHLEASVSKKTSIGRRSSYRVQRMAFEILPRNAGMV